MMMPSQPARLSWKPSRPPTEVSATAPVSGERDITVERPEVGAMVPTSGPVKKSSGMSGWSQGRVIKGRRNEPANPLPPIKVR